jgi:hypothetical protein
MLVPGVSRGQNQPAGRAPEAPAVPPEAIRELNQQLAGYQQQMRFVSNEIRYATDVLSRLPVVVICPRARTPRRNYSRIQNIDVREINERAGLAPLRKAPEPDKPMAKTQKSE